MATRRIRLTESELTNLIRRIVEDTEEMNEFYPTTPEERDEVYNTPIFKGSKIYPKTPEEIDNIEIDDIDMGDDMSKQEAIKKIAEFLQDEVLTDLSPREIKTLERKVDKSDSNVSENIYEDDEDLSSRKASRREKMMMRGGLGIAATGAVLALGEFMGYSEFETTSMLHDLNHMAGLERYTGPVTVAMVFAGLALALKGLDSRYRRTGN